MYEVERYRLDIFGFIYVTYVRLWKQFRGKELDCSRTVPGLALRQWDCTLGVLPVDDRVVFLDLRVGERVLTVVCSYAPIDSSDYPAFLNLLGGGLECALQLSFWESLMLTHGMTVRPGGA